MAHAHTVSCRVAAFTLHTLQTHSLMGRMRRAILDTSGSVEGGRGGGAPHSSGACSYSYSLKFMSATFGTEQYVEVVVKRKYSTDYSKGGEASREAPSAARHVTSKRNVLYTDLKFRLSCSCLNSSEWPTNELHYVRWSASRNGS